jgi:hypothetical protein
MTKIIFKGLLIGCVAVMAACTTNEPAHLPAEKMQAVLKDIQLAETYSTMVVRDSAHLNNEKNTDSLALYYKEIFQHHHVTQQEFESSLKYYEQHPDDLDSIYGRILTDMNKIQGENPMR